MKLTPDRRRNPRPLSPHDLEKLGLVTDNNYSEENHKVTVFCTSNMGKELSLLGTDDLLKARKPNIFVAGGGLGRRDLLWFGTAIRKGFSLEVRDVSKVAAHNIHKFFQQWIDLGRIKIVIGEIEETLESTKIDHKRTIAYFASQFFQVLDPGKMERVLGEIAVTMSRWPSHIPSKPRIYLMHPLFEDNQGPKKWGGVQLPFLKWGDTTPYTLEQLRIALESLLGDRKVIIEVLDKVYYFHQCYSFIRVMLA